MILFIVSLFVLVVSLVAGAVAFMYANTARVKIVEADMLIGKAKSLKRVYTRIETFDQDADYFNKLTELSHDPVLRFYLLRIREEAIETIYHAQIHDVAAFGYLKAINDIIHGLDVAKTNYQTLAGENKSNESEV